MKIAISGSTCAGKTTLCHLLVARLKEKGQRAEYVGNTTRRMPFDPRRLDVSMPAQYHVIFQHMAEEAAAEAREDLDIIVCDRTPLDYLFYARESVWTRLPARGEDIDIFPRLHGLVYAWLGTYHRRYFVDASEVSYFRDGKRPETTDLRDAVNKLFLQSEESTFIKVTGSPDERVDFILKDLAL